MPGYDVLLVLHRCHSRESVMLQFEEEIVVLDEELCGSVGGGGLILSE